MSELRDLTTALRAFDKRLTSIEDCLVILLRDSNQQSEWRHFQKNEAMINAGEKEEQRIAMQQLQEACGSLSHRLFEFSDRLDANAKLRQDDLRVLNQRVRELEIENNRDEVTKA
jgi:hypothetical protein